MHSLPTVPTRYTRTAISLHLVIAILLITLFVAGIVMTDLPGSSTKYQIISWHKWGGIAVLALTVIRLIWRITHRPPALPIEIKVGMTTWQTLFHQITVFLFYVLCLLIPLVGWMMSNAAGYPLVWFNLISLPNLIAPNPSLVEILKGAHQWLAYAIATLVVLHLLGAVKHQWLDKHPFIGRMWFK